MVEHLPTPDIFKTWAAISALAGAMERRVFTHFPSWGLNLYPNMYILLVGPPGVGKGLATNRVEDLWEDVEEFHVAPRSVSKASLMDSLAEAKCKRMLPRGELLEYNSLLVVANEFGSFIPIYDNEFMAALTDIYDGRPYEERKRTRELKFRIEAPQLNLIAGDTPSHLTGLMPEGAWEQGFMSRTLFIFSGEQKITNPFAVEMAEMNMKNQSIYKDLVNDLKVIAHLHGKFDWEPAAVQAYANWYMGGREPVPTHPRLANYLPRRHTHLAKLCMVASISRTDSLTVSLEDYQLALGWLVEAEFYMPDLFKSMVVGADTRAIEDTYHYIFTQYTKTKKPVPEYLIIAQLMTKVPAHSVTKVLDNMIRSNKIKEHSRDGQNRPMYIPVSAFLQGS